MQTSVSFLFAYMCATEFDLSCVEKESPMGLFLCNFVQDPTDCLDAGQNPTLHNPAEQNLYGLNPTRQNHVQYKIRQYEETALQNFVSI